MRSGRLNALDAVPIETPASAATSRRVTLPDRTDLATSSRGPACSAGLSSADRSLAGRWPSDLSAADRWPSDLSAADRWPSDLSAADRWASVALRMRRWSPSATGGKHRRFGDESVQVANMNRFRYPL